LENAAWDDRELVRRCKEGSEAGYAELVRRHRQRLLNLAYRLTADQDVAEDVVQEAFLAAFRGMERFEPQPALAPWLNTITVRLAVRHATRRSQLPRSIDNHWSQSVAGDGGSASELYLATDPSTDPAAASERAELRRELQDAISELPSKERAAVVLRLVMGLEYAEAAQTMDVPLNTYKSHLLRGTRRLREALADRLRHARESPTTVTVPADERSARSSFSPTVAARLDGPAEPALAPRAAPAGSTYGHRNQLGSPGAPNVRQEHMDLADPIVGLGGGPPRGPAAR